MRDFARRNAQAGLSPHACRGHGASHARNGRELRDCCAQSLQHFNRENMYEPLNVSSCLSRKVPFLSQILTTGSLLVLTVCVSSSWTEKLEGVLVSYCCCNAVCKDLVAQNHTNGVHSGFEGQRSGMRLTAEVKALARLVPSRGTCCPGSGLLPPPPALRGLPGSHSSASPFPPSAL